MTLRSLFSRFTRRTSALRHTHDWQHGAYRHSYFAPTPVRRCACGRYEFWSDFADAWIDIGEDPRVVHLKHATWFVDTFTQHPVPPEFAEAVRAGVIRQGDAVASLGVSDNGKGERGVCFLREHGNDPAVWFTGPALLALAALVNQAASSDHPHPLEKAS